MPARAPRLALGQAEVERALRIERDETRDRFERERAGGEGERGDDDPAPQPRIAAAPRDAAREAPCADGRREEERRREPAAQLRLPAAQRPVRPHEAAEQRRRDGGGEQRRAGGGEGQQQREESGQHDGKVSPIADAASGARVGPADGAESRPMTSDRLRPVAIALFALAALATLALVGWCMAGRLPWDHELSKMEGGFVDHARWAAAGRPIHAAPSAEFASFLYMPLFHHVAGWLVRAGLDGYAATRAVSLAGVVGATLLGMALVARATARRGLAWLVPLLVLARYFDVECFYDQARPDDLMALFLMAALFALALPRAAVAAPLFALMGALAFFTKQSAAAFLAVVLVLQLLVRWRVAIASGALLLAATVPAYLALDTASDGWMTQYCFTIAKTHRLDLRGFARLAGSEMAGPFLLPALLAAGGAALVAREAWRRRGRGLTAQRELFAPPGEPTGRALAWHAGWSGALAAIAFSLASSTQVLAVRNVWVMSALAVAPFVPLALERAIERRLAPALRSRGWSAAWLVLAASIAIGWRDPRPFRPVAGDEREWQELHAALARFAPPERTWITLHGASWGGRAGEPFHLHFGALSDLMGGYYGTKTGIELPSDLVERIATKWYGAIVIADWDPRIREVIGASYEPAADVRAFRLPMFSGNESGKSVVWIPKP